MEQKKYEKAEVKQHTKQRSRQESKQGKVTSMEDKVLKVAMQAFGEDVMKYLGQEGKVKRVAPTEHVHLETKQMLEDFNFEMAGGFWRHYEFESDRISVADMRRFREYEAFLSMTYQVPVITTVLCSAKVKKLRSRLKEGINIYNVEAVQLKKKDADKVLRKAWKKLKADTVFEKEDLIPVLLTPLMSGKSTVYERIQQGFRILKHVQDRMDEQNVKKMQAILYAFACKFLNNQELEMVRKETGMTVLGQMLMEDGIELGIEQGIEQGISVLIESCREFNMSREKTFNHIIKKFGLSDTKAEMFMEKYW